MSCVKIALSTVFRPLERILETYIAPLQETNSVQALSFHSSSQKNKEELTAEDGELRRAEDRSSEEHNTSRPTLNKE